MAAASSTVPAPMVPISIRSKSLFSSGRSTRSMTSPTTPVTAIAAGTATANGSRADRVKVEATYAPIISTAPWAKLTRPMVR